MGDDDQVRFQSTPHMSAVEGENHNEEQNAQQTGSNVWFRTGKDTKVIIRPLTSAAEVKLDKGAPAASEREKYCEDNAYVSLKKVIRSQLKEGKFKGKVLYTCTVLYLKMLFGSSRKTLCGFFK